MEKLSKYMLNKIEQAEVDNPGALIALFNPHGVFLYSSLSTETILGWPRDYALGHNITELYKQPEATHIQLTIQDALLRDESVITTRNTPLKEGGTRRMRGAFTKIIDEASGQPYLLSIANPAEPY